MSLRGNPRENPTASEEKQTQTMYSFKPTKSLVSLTLIIHSCMQILMCTQCIPWKGGRGRNSPFEHVLDFIAMVTASGLYLVRKNNQSMNHVQDPQFNIQPLQLWQRTSEGIEGSPNPRTVDVSQRGEHGEERTL